MADASPSVVLNGKYRLLAQLDQGSMGVVFRAEQLDTEGRPQREVAVKILKSEYAESEVIAKRFLREVKVAMRLHGPHVVTVHESGRDVEGRLYYVMELIQGQTLKVLLRTQGPLTVERAVHIAAQICEGLAEAHGLPEPVIHRDLKPANIFVERPLGQDWVKIGDFGIAKVLGEHTAELTATGIIGTPQYMAPEQWYGGKRVDARTDLYALGVVLYEMLSGRVPFRADNMGEMMHKHLSEIPPVLPAEIPERLRSLVKQLLAKNPDERPHDALAVHQALAQSLKSDGEENTILLEGIRDADQQETEINSRGRNPFPEVRQDEKHESVPASTLPTQQLPRTTPEPRRQGSGKDSRKIVGIALALVLLGGGLWWSRLLPPLSFSREAAAVRQYRQAAERGDAVAQFNLGVLYAQGRGVTRDDSEAARWYRQAAEQGNTDAQNNLGALYAQGRGVPRDFAEAARWYRQAAEQGSAAAQNNLGLLYAQGQGVTQDLAEALRWYRKAAEQGNADAQYNLGMFYSRGLTGGPPGYTEAAKWYRKAAEQGYVLGQINLGELYAQGRGVPQDMTEATHWYRKAAEQGNAEARERLKKILGVDAITP